MKRGNKLGCKLFCCGFSAMCTFEEIRVDQLCQFNLKNLKLDCLLDKALRKTLQHLFLDARNELVRVVKTV